MQEVNYPFLPGDSDPDYDNPEGTLDIITYLFENYGGIDPLDQDGPRLLIIGDVDNGNSITLNDPVCVIDLLPSAGGSKVLADGDDVTDEDCGLEYNAQKKGTRLKNNLATNTIALQLNLWYSLANGTDLGSLGLVDNNQCIDFVISQSILDLLDDEGIDETVGGLLELANGVLAGTISASPGQVVSAVTMINEYFDECSTGSGCDSEEEFRVNEEASFADDQVLLRPNPIMYSDIEILIKC